MGRLTDPSSYMPSFLTGDLTAPMARTLMEGGAQQAAYTMAGGQAMQGAVAGVAGAAQQGVQAYQAQKAQDQIGQAVTGLISKYKEDPDNFDSGAEMKNLGLTPRLVGQASDLFNKTMQAQSLADLHTQRAKEFAAQAEEHTAQATQIKHDEAGNAAISLAKFAKQDPQSALVLAKARLHAGEALGDTVPPPLAQYITSLDGQPDDVVKQGLGALEPWGVQMLSSKALEEYQKSQPKPFEHDPTKAYVVPDSSDPTGFRTVIPAQEKATTPYEQKRLDIELAHLHLAQQKAAFDQGTGATGPVSPSGQTGPMGSDYLATLPPDRATAVKAWAEGRMPVPSGKAWASPQFQSLQRDILAYDPTFDAGSYPARAAARKDFTSTNGRSGQALTAFDQLATHMNEVDKAIDDLGNFREGSLGPLTGTANWVKSGWQSASGSPVVGRLRKASNAVAEEATRLWRGAQGNEADIKEWRRGFEGASSPEDMKGQLAMIASLAMGKGGALKEARDRALGIGGSDIEVGSKDTWDTLNRLAGIATAPAQGQANPFRK